MGVFVKGMEMPDNCLQCSFCHEIEEYCMANHNIYIEEDYDKRRPEWCPLINVKQPHGRLVDIEGLASDNWNVLTVYDHERIGRAPTIIEAEE